jgi:hypothetical protein
MQAVGEKGTQGIQRIHVFRLQLVFGDKCIYHINIYMLIGLKSFHPDCSSPMQDKSDFNKSEETKNEEQVEKHPPPVAVMLPIFKNIPFHFL